MSIVEEVKKIFKKRKTRKKKLSFTNDKNEGRARMNFTSSSDITR